MGGTGGSPTHYISVRFRDDQNGRLSFYTEAGGGGFQLNTNRLFRDTTGWMHIVVAVNSADSTQSNRQRMYVNGVEETSFSSTTAMSLNSNLGFNDSSDVIYLFRKQQDTDHFPGYACEVAFIDGQQLAPTAFGEFDEDSPTHWKPIDFKNDVTFGTNGFYLEFKDSSDLGADTSGNGNDLNTSLAGATSQSTDTCTNNFATLNDLVIGNSPTLTEGNLKFSSSDANWRASASTIGVTQGKWYAEFKLDSANDYVNTGIATMSHFQQTTNVKIGYTSTSYGYDANNGNYYVGDSATSYGASLSSGDILGVALDLDNNKLYFSKNGTFQNSGDPTSGSTGTGAISITSGLEYFIATSAYGSGKGTSANFGSPAYSISSGNSDANGHGNFEYSVPSGYFALCTKNLAENG